MSERTRFFALGGLDEIGKNCYVIEINDDIFVVAAGIKWPDRTMPGIDYVIPDFTYLKENKERIACYLLPHGHDDEIGALAYLYKDAPAPVYGSKITLQMLRNFTKHVGLDPKIYDLHEVKPTSEFKVKGRKISFFQTAHNIAESSGISISTDQGNLIIPSDFVIENSADRNFLCDLSAISLIAKTPTLALFGPSSFASRSGYNAPRYKIAPHIDQEVKNAPGRVFIAMRTINFYNIDEVISLAIAHHKKIIPYDEETARDISEMQAAGQLAIPSANFAPSEDLNRYRGQDVIVLVLGYNRLFNKIALLAAGQNEGRPIRLGPDDTFIMAAPADDNTELESTDALDTLFRTGCHVHNITSKEFYRMHACEEDLKMLIATVHPKYYVPVGGFYKDLLDNAKIAVNMKCGLDHRSVFLLDPGMSLIFDDNGAHLLDEKIPHGDVLIDGSGVGDVGENVLEDRQKLAEGLVIFAITIDAKKARVVAGPDVQIRGVVFPRDTQSIVEELSRSFLEIVDEAFQNGDVDLDGLREECYERLSRLVRRLAGGEAMVLPLILEI